MNYNTQTSLNTPYYHVTVLNGVDPVSVKTLSISA